MIGPVAAVLCVAVFTQAAAQRYEVVESGTCESHGLLQITNVAQCQTAVGLLGFGDTSASTETSAHYPGACYYYNRNSF